MHRAISMSAIGALAFVVFTWGVNWILIKDAVAAVAPLEFTACRLLGGALLIAVARRPWETKFMCLPMKECRARSSACFK